MSKKAAELFVEAQTLAQSLFEKEEWDKAAYTTQTALDQARDLLDGSQTSLKHLVNCLELHSRSLNMKGQSEDSRQEVREALRVINHLDRDQLDHEQHARIETSHAVMSDSMGYIEDAIRSYQNGVDAYEKMNPVPIEEMADLLNNLAYLHKYQDHKAEAEDAFLKALETLEKDGTQETERVAMLKNNLGALYQQMEDFDKAESRFLEALRVRESVLGKEHPDTAQTHGNLAIAVASKGEQDKALEHFESALNIYAKVAKDYAEDFEIIADNYIDYLDMLEKKDDLDRVTKLKAEKLA